LMVRIREVADRHRQAAVVDRSSGDQPQQNEVAR
jgi:hypothetical protein